jgi:hypothetical protein
LELSEVGNGTCIDAARTNSTEGRMINDPAGTGKRANVTWSANQPAKRATLKAKRGIKKGEELYVNYGKQYGLPGSRRKAAVEDESEPESEVDTSSEEDEETSRVYEAAWRGILRAKERMADFVQTALAAAQGIDDRARKEDQKAARDQPRYQTAEGLARAKALADKAAAQVKEAQTGLRNRSVWPSIGETAAQLKAVAKELTAVAQGMDVVARQIGADVRAALGAKKTAGPKGSPIGADGPTEQAKDAAVDADKLREAWERIASQVEGKKSQPIHVGAICVDADGDEPDEAGEEANTQAEQLTAATGSSQVTAATNSSQATIINQTSESQQRPASSPEEACFDWMFSPGEEARRVRRRESAAAAVVAATAATSAAAGSDLDAPRGSEIRLARRRSRSRGERASPRGDYVDPDDVKVAEELPPRNTDRVADEGREVNPFQSAADYELRRKLQDAVVRRQHRSTSSVSPRPRRQFRPLGANAMRRRGESMDAMRQRVRQEREEEEVIRGERERELREQAAGGPRHFATSGFTRAEHVLQRQQGLARRGSDPGALTAYERDRLREQGEIAERQRWGHKWMDNPWAAADHRTRQQAFDQVAADTEIRIQRLEQRLGSPPREADFARPTMWLRSQLTAQELEEAAAASDPPMNGCPVVDTRWGANEMEPRQRRHRKIHRRQGMCRAQACPCCFTRDVTHTGGVKYNACACRADESNHLGLCLGCWRVKMGKVADQVGDRFALTVRVDGACQMDSCNCCRRRAGQVSCGCAAVDGEFCECCSTMLKTLQG